uniref:S-adenosyl-L-methionine:O-methyltransferase n=1 Tax=Papaver somniferum TaxID=3469 RepID=A0A0H4ILZ3_PAPSO|nr:S-adenosyl-L-methionine:O-methyltransferase [Papaver somniferum]
MEATKSDQANQANIWKLIYGFAESLVLKCAIQLEIADTIHNHGEPMSLSELASKLPVQPVNSDRLYRVMRYLVHMKLFNKEKTSINGEFKYSLAPPAKFLIKGWEKSMVASILAINDKDFLAPWHHLKDGLSGDCDAFEKALGKSIWVYMSENPEKNQLFNEAMACDTRLVTSALVNDCQSVFKGINTLVDVGGGTGTAVKAISKAFPHIKCSIYDLPHVIADSPEIPNVVKIEGDMFKAIPSADAILMKCILHDWNDDECIQILKKCKEAVPQEGGKVIIVDVVLNMDLTHPYSKIRLTLDLDMMLNTGGKERTVEEWKKLIDAAGFASFKITEISAVQSVIEAFPY